MWKFGKTSLHDHVLDMNKTALKETFKDSPLNSDVVYEAAQAEKKARKAANSSDDKSSATTETVETTD